MKVDVVSSGKSIPTLKELKLRREVLEGNYYPAINLVDIDSGTAPQFLRDPVEFFKRTAVTPGVKTLVVKVLMAVMNMRQAVVGGAQYTITSKLFVLPSLFGGGKSHALATVYHVVKVISESRTWSEAYEKLSVLDKDIAGFVKDNWSRFTSIKPKVVVVHGESREHAPSPLDGKPVKTIWGYIADKLGEYQLMSTYDQNTVAPPTDVLEKVLGNKGAVVLIDEIAYYYSRIKPEFRSVVNAFIMGLSELLGSKEVPSTAVVITLPYDYERDVVEKAHTGLLDVAVIKRIIDRTREEVIRVVAPEDLARVIRRRVFDEDPDRLRELGEKLARTMVETAQAVDVKPILGKLVAELPNTYPVHPETIETLKVVHERLSEYLQLTRNPIHIIASAVKAVNQGCFSWLGFEPYILMPYHIPVFDEHLLLRTLPATERDLYRFKSILEEAIVKPTAVAERCEPVLTISDHVSREYAKPAYAIAVYLWLRSLAGRGLVSNISIYPTSDAIAYAILDLPVVNDDKWYDVMATLERELSRLPHIREEGGRWFFKWTPRIKELIERYAEKITASEVESWLVDYLRNNMSDRGTIVFTGSPSDMLFINEVDRAGGKHPAVVVFTREVTDDELGRIRYNNVVVLAPDTRTSLPREELKRLEIPRADTLWEALQSVVKHLIACGKLTEKDIKREYEEEIEADKNLAEDLLKKVTNIRSDYSERARELVARVYRTITIKRGQKLLTIEIKTVRREPPGFRVIENELLGSYVLSSVAEDWILKLAEKLGMKPDTPDGIPLTNIWQYLLTGDDPNIPIVSLSWFVRNVLQVVKNLEYGVIVKDKVYWKRVYDSKDTALQQVKTHGRDVLEDKAFEQLVREVARMIESVEDVRLVHYRHLWLKWAEQVSGEHKDEILVLTDGAKERVLDIKALREEVLAEELVKNYAVYREKPSVAVSIEHPEQVEPGTTVKVVLSATSGLVSRARLRITVAGAKPEMLEKDIEIPYREELALETSGGARDVRVSVVVEDPKIGSVLGRGEAVMVVKKPFEEELEEKWLTAKELRELINRGVEVMSIEELEVTKLGDYNLSLHILREIGEEAHVKARFDRIVVESTSPLAIDEAAELVDSVARLKDRFNLSEFTVTVKISENNRQRSDVLQRIPEDVKLKVVIKRRRGEQR